MKKTFSRLVAIVALVAIFVTMFAGMAIAEQYVTTTGNSNLRKGPGLDYGTITSVSANTKLTYKGSSATDDRGVVWYKVKYKSGSAWISSKYSKLGGGGSQNVVANKGQTYLRTKPSLNGKAITIMSKGSKATYLNKTSVDDRGVAWYKVNLNGDEGWVSSKYTSLGGSPSPSKKTKVVADGGSTNLRKAASLDADTITSMPKGATATYLGDSKKDHRGVRWYKVKYNGKTGWVSSKYTTLK